MGMEQAEKKDMEKKEVEEPEKEKKALLPGGVTLEYVSKETLLGMTIGFAQIPESVAFAFLANIKPPIALHAAWMVGLFCSLFGGRPGMVNGATGAFAAIIATFLPEPLESGGNGKGVETLFPSVIFAGVLMLLVAWVDLSRFILLLPAPVMIGFCNGLAIVIGKAQLHPFEDSDTHEIKPFKEVSWMIVIMMASMLTMEFLPKLKCKIFKVIPSSLCAIIVAVLLEFCLVRPLDYRTDTIGDVSKFTSDTAYPCPFFIDSPGREYDLDALGYAKDKGFLHWVTEGVGATIIKQGFLLCVVGTIESLMTSEVVESFVKTPSDGRRTVFAMGLGNVMSGFMGGMGGNAMIGLSTINVLNGGKGRLSPTVTALVVMAACVGAYPLLNYIPVAALAGIMIVVVLHTFKWFSLYMVLNLLPSSIRSHLGSFGQRKIPRVETIVIITVTLVSVFANIAYSVIAGVCICAIAFSWNAAKILEVRHEDRVEEKLRIYYIEGPVYFTTANRLLKMFDVDEDPENVEVVFGYSSLMDYTAISTLHRIACEYKDKGKEIKYASLNMSSQSLVAKANHLVSMISVVEGQVKEPVELKEQILLPPPIAEQGTSTSAPPMEDTAEI